MFQAEFSLEKGHLKPPDKPIGIVTDISIYANDGQSWELTVR